MIPLGVFEGAIRGFLAPIAPLLEDDSVTEVLVNGPSEVFVERAGVLRRTERRFESVEQLTSALRVIAQYAGRSFDERRPILEAWLPDGARIEALLPRSLPPDLASRSDGFRKNDSRSTSCSRRAH